MSREGSLEFKFKLSDVKLGVQSKWEEYSEPPAFETNIGYSGVAEPLKYGHDRLTIVLDGKNFEIEDFEYTVHISCNMKPVSHSMNHLKASGMIMFKDDGTASIYLTVQGFIDVVSVRALSNLAIYTQGTEDVNNSYMGSEGRLEDDRLLLSWFLLTEDGHQK